ncbi:MAG TPA: NAD(P)/FAD-dependent oxidoreductase, partial [Acidimicrobiales bacterium]|nr:NAD(P)/FAD-dependent oxidoreductase [Acidimicrobiales bacterium]
MTAPTTYDPDALRERYRRERDKRLRPDGNDQYIEIAGRYAHYLEDPYVERVERPPLNDEVTVALIGGGFAGLIAGARLKQAGIDDIRIIEKGGGFGGTWYWNRYPGAQCDVESYIYLPLLEETGYVPTEKYARAPEILEHCDRIARHFGLYDNACLSTEVTAIDWDAGRSRWIIRTDRGDAMAARFLIMGNGPLHRPKLPGIEGIESFKGHSFHTSRWDYEYTGGDSNGNLSKLADKRVAVIGTGATAVQAVPHLAASAAELYVFQRTPSSIDVRGNRPTDPDWAAALQPGWQRQRIENFTVLTSGGVADQDLVMDGWTDIIGKLLTRLNDTDSPDFSPEAMAATMELADFDKMEQIRARVDSIVEDPATADALKPWYRQFCKRPCFHDEYLQAFNRPNVHLVDTDGKGVDRITPSGVVVAGREYEVDCIIYATGFEVGTSYARRAGYDVVGVDGLTLSDYWADGMKSMFGVHVHGFPNLLILGHTQGGFTANYPHLLDEA